MQENIYFEGYYTGLRELLVNGAIRGIGWGQNCHSSAEKTDLYCQVRLLPIYY